MNWKVKVVHLEASPNRKILENQKIIYGHVVGYALQGRRFYETYMTVPIGVLGGLTLKFILAI